MQASVGGSEAKVVESIAQNIEDRLVTKKKIRSIFSSTDFMITAFDVFPFIAVIFIYLALPDLVEPILENITSLMIVVALLLFTIIGSVIIRKKISSAKGE